MDDYELIRNRSTPEGSYIYIYIFCLCMSMFTTYAADEILIIYIYILLIVAIRNKYFRNSSATPTVSKIEFSSLHSFQFRMDVSLSFPSCRIYMYLLL